MVAKELINHMIPPLKETDSAAHAIVWMEEFRCKQLPVVSKGKFMGLISEEQILDINDASRPIADLKLFCNKCFVQDTQHFYDVIKMASDNDVEIVGVVNQDGLFEGVITIQDTITAFAQTTAVQAPGGIIVISLPAIDYSLAEISRLVESNNARILSSSVKEDDFNNQKLKVTLKINQSDLSAVVATLERFEYKVIARFQEKESGENDQERIDILLRYLDI
jgi:CBS domain-containing protein